MSFTVNFYNNADDPIVLNKTPTELFSAYMTPLGEINELNPYFEVKYSSAYDSVNYAHIAIFNKWYFVVKSLLPNNMWGLQFVVDPLMSNKTAIENLTCVIKRAGTITEPTYVQDELLPLEPSRMYIKEYRFTGGDGSPHIRNGGITNHILIQTI